MWNQKNINAKEMTVIPIENVGNSLKNTEVEDKVKAIV